nr:hypothetical protein [Ktedonobacteraceae bacterium]
MEINQRQVQAVGVKIGLTVTGDVSVARSSNAKERELTTTR